MKTIGICCDHAGFEVKEVLIGYLESQGIAFKDYGTYSEDSCDYADYAHAMAKGMEQGEVFPGIAICGSANGINMTMNKHQMIRSALCWKPEIAMLARQHNDANVVAIPGRFVSHEEAIEILATFLETEFEGGRHSARVEKIAIK
ncbi:MAG: RpiB/LacA/LacB family sugar-phosphate isomerase [Bacteroidales bacterium]